jgi:hypothetical protein
MIVVDIDHLQHAIKRRQDGTFTDVANQKVDYLYKQFKGLVNMVFDSYGNGPCVKDHEHRRRAKKHAPDIVFDNSWPTKVINRPSFLF